MPHTLGMKRFVIWLMSMICLTSCMFPVRASGAEERELYRGTVAHFFTHCLIAHPEIAFAPQNPYGKYLAQDCLTPLEFSRILEQAYANGYVLVDIARTYRAEGERMVRCPFSVPKGKKPLVLSFDDVVYAQKNLGRGMVDKLVLADGIATSTAGVVERDREFVCILEEFIRLHPDFSDQGARGILCLTGFDGILGYRTQSGSPDRAKELEEVKPVVAALKAAGWRFASHSYCHGHMKQLTVEQMEYDAAKWDREVRPLVGATPLYAYPYGEWVFDGRQEVLKSHGFKVFFGVGAEPFYAGMPLRAAGVEQVLFMDRSPMDGYALQHNRARYLSVFDCDAVYDSVRARAGGV